MFIERPVVTDDLGEIATGRIGERMSSPPCQACKDFVKGVENYFLARNHFQFARIFHDSMDK